MFKIWKWLKGLFSNGSGESDLYSPKERLIYTYFNGKELVQADPIRLFRRMADRGVELKINMELAMSLSKDAAKGYQKLVDGVRDVFQVKGLEEGGLTEAECFDLLNHFTEYCDEIKKNSSPTPTLRVATSSSTSSPPVVLPTSPTSASGSTESGRSTDEPPPRPSEPELPSGPSTPAPSTTET